jgi:hypothetical protein
VTVIAAYVLAWVPGKPYHTCLDLSLCTGPTTDGAGLWPRLTHDD